MDEVYPLILAAIKKAQFDGLTSTSVTIFVASLEDRRKRLRPMFDNAAVRLKRQYDFINILVMPVEEKRSVSPCLPFRTFFGLRIKFSW